MKTNPTKAAIILEGLAVIDKPTPIKNVSFENEQQLIKYLKSEQDGYCEGERPKINRSTIEINGKKVNRIKAYAYDSDWSYVALLGVTFSNMPIESLTNY